MHLKQLRLWEAEEEVEWLGAFAFSIFHSGCQSGSKPRNTLSVDKNHPTKSLSQVEGPRRRPHRTSPVPPAPTQVSSGEAPSPSRDRSLQGVEPVTIASCSLGSTPSPALTMPVGWSPVTIRKWRQRCGTSSHLKEKVKRGEEPREKGAEGRDS